MRSIRWEMRPLGALADFRNGINYDKGNFGVGIKVLGVKDFQDRTRPNYADLEEINPEGVVRENNLLRNGDVVFVRSNGTRELIGRSLLITDLQEPVTHSGFTIRARFTSPITYPPFFAYLFRTDLIRQALTAHGGGTNINNLNQGILSRLEIPTPPLEEQHRLAGILSAYDDLTENNLRRIHLLEEMARTIYREWFVHFRFPGHEGLSSAESALGPLPKGWRAATLRDVVDLTMGQSPPGTSYNENGDGFPFHQGVRDFADRFPSDRLYCTADGRLAEAGDILFSVRAPVGRMNIAQKRMVIGRGVSALRHKQGYQPFLWEQLQERFQEEDMIGNGAIFASVTKRDMEQVMLLSPPEPILTRADQVLRPIHELIAVLSAQSANLRATRDLLLPCLMSGRLSLAEAERVV